MRGRWSRTSQLARRYRAAGCPFAAGSAAMRSASGCTRAGSRSLVEGWTKNLAAGASSASPWPVLRTVWWVAAGARRRRRWSRSPAADASVAPVARLGRSWPRSCTWLLRRVGSFRWWTAAAFLVPLAVFVALFAVLAAADHRAPAVELDGAAARRARRAPMSLRVVHLPGRGDRRSSTWSRGARSTPAPATWSTGSRPRLGTTPGSTGRRRFEGERLYRDVLRIQRWKDRLPEAGALFAGGVCKRAAHRRRAGGLERFVVETRRAELGHWLAAAAGPLFVLWNPPRRRRGAGRLRGRRQPAVHRDPALQPAAGTPGARRRRARSSAAGPPSRRATGARPAAASRRARRRRGGGRGATSRSQSR